MGKLINLNDIKKKKEKKKKITNILFAIIIIYIFYAVYLIIKTPTDTVIVESGTLTAEQSATGYIVRDETVVKGKNYKNGINQIILEGERAAKKQVIFRYYSKNESELQKKIEEVNVKIQKALEKEETNYSTDIKNLEEQIDEQIKNLKSINDVKKISEYKKQISDIMEKKTKISGENSKRGSYIKKLIEERESYEKKLDKGSEYVKSPKSGVISYRVDGLENVLKASDVNKITEQQLNELELKTGQIISASNEEAKVMNNFECYLLTILDSESAKQAEVGKNAQITLASGQEINAKIDFINEQENEKVLVGFKLNTLTEEMISYRKISFNITWWSQTGMKVPNESIVEEDEQNKYVLKKNISGTTKCLINVLKSNDKYSIIRALNVEELKNLGIDQAEYNRINVHDSVMLYPKK